MIRDGDKEDPLLSDGEMVIIASQRRSHKKKLNPLEKLEIVLYR